MARKKQAEQPVTDAELQQQAVEAHTTAVEQALSDQPAEPVPPGDIPVAEPAAPEPATTETPPAEQPAKPQKGPGRGWSERYVQPVKYRMFSLKDQKGTEQILFQVDLPAGQTKPPEEVVNVFRAHKFWKDGEAYGLAEDAKTNEESYSTGLMFGTHPKHPKAWVINADTSFGRDVALSLEQALSEVAKKIEAGGPKVG